MEFSKTGMKILKAFIDDKIQFIISVGSSRSGKTYGTLQVLVLAALKSNKPLTITIVGHSLPNLKDSVIPDLESIITACNIDVSRIRTQSPHVYRIHNSILKVQEYSEHKAHGGSRDFLYIDEANLLDVRIVDQLIQRTRGKCIFSYNPSENCEWLEELAQEKDAVMLKSTFRDNAKFLSKKMLNFFLKKYNLYKRDIEKGLVTSYNIRYWMIYGMGKPSKLEGVIFPFYNKVKDWDNIEYDYRVWGYDPGWTDQTALCEVKINEKAKKLYLKEHIYKSELSPDATVKEIKKINGIDILICDGANPSMVRHLQNNKINAYAPKKCPINQRIAFASEYDIFVDENSKNMIYELENYVWDEKAKKLGEKNPVDKNNHLIDAGIGYAFASYYKAFINVN